MKSWILLAALAACAHKPSMTTTLVGTGLDRLEVAPADGPWAPAAEDPALLATGQWIEVDGVAAYVYVDGEKGMSARWQDPGAEGMVHIRRLMWAPAAHRVLSADEVAARGLPATPDWLAAYGPQPRPGTPYGAWRAAPELRHRFHPDYPDDLRAIISSGGGRSFEVVWVGLRGCDGLRCTGSLLNQPDGAPGLTVGSVLDVDLTGVARDRLPVGSIPGQAPDPALLRFAAEAPELAGLLQDDTLWEVDMDLLPQDRLVPLGSWGRVGAEPTFLFLGPGGPVALVLGAAGARFQSLTWLPRGWQPMTDAERDALGLPASPQIEGAVPHAPGPWGTWRVDPATAWVFRSPEEPDGVVALLSGSREGLTTGKEPVGTLLVDGCDGALCQGTLTADVERFRAGERFEILVVRPLQVDEHWLPVARPVATSAGGSPSPR